MRLKYILLGLFLLVFLWFIFLLILPVYWIRILEKEIVLFVLPLIFSIHYSINKYHFVDFKIWLWKILIFIFSVFLSVLFVNILKYIYLAFWNSFSSFWGLSWTFWIVDLIAGIFLYTYFDIIFNRLFLLNNSLKIFEKKLNSLKNYIPYISSLDELNNFLKNNFYWLFKIGHVKVILFKNNKKSELFKYFSKNISRKIFINDIVFIEENKHKFDLKKLKKEFDDSVNIIFPMFNNKQELIWVFEIWNKPFKDQFYSEEIDIIRDFVSFLVWHLKYIDIYSDINDLNINLDKKVDEKNYWI